MAGYLNKFLQHAAKRPTNRQRIVALTAGSAICLTGVGCTSKIKGHLAGEVGGASADAIFGHVVGSSVFQLSLQDKAPEVVLYALGDDTDLLRATPALTTSLAPDGTFAFTDISSAKIDLTGATAYQIEVHSDNEFLSRTVTGHQNQNISPGSTLISYLLNLDPQSHGVEVQQIRRGLADRKDLGHLIDAVAAAPDSGAAFELLSASAAAFRQVFGLSPDILRDAPPRVLSLVMPAKGREKEPLSYGVSAAHWDIGYRIGYLWEMDGAPFAQSANVVLTPSFDQVGVHAITLRLGHSDSHGNLVPDGTYRTYDVNLAVDAIPEAVVPPLHLGGHALQTTPVSVSTRDLAFVLDSDGTPLCAAFAALAVTENDAAPPPAAAFTLTCQNLEKSPEFAYRLSRPGDGQSTLRVWAVNTAGRVNQTPWLLAVTLDTEAPGDFSVSSPTGLLATRNATVAWSHAADVDKYDLSIGRDAACSTPLLHLSDLSAETKNVVVPEDGTFYACIAAVDLAGNKTLRSGTFSVDTVAPSVSMALPASYVALTNQAAFAVNGSCSETGRAVNVTVETPPSTAVSASPTCTGGTWSTALNLAGVSDGTVVLAATQTDAAGNTAAAAERTVTKDSVPPGAFNVSTPASNAYINTATPSLSWTAAAGASRYDLSVGTAAGCPSPLATKSATGLAVTLDSLADGAYVLCLKASDAAGNTTTAGNSSLAFTVDTINPGSFAVAGPAPFTNSATPTATWSAASGASSYDVAVGTTSNCATPVQSYAAVVGTTKTLTSLSDGTYHLCIGAADAASNRTAASNTGYAFQVDTAAPTLASFSVNGGAASTGNNYLSISLTGSDTASNITKFCLKYNTTTAPAAGDSCWTAVNAPQPGLTPAKTLAISNYHFNIGFSPGAYALHAWLIDAAGNISSLGGGGAGADGVDSGSITYAPGTPPNVTNVLAVSSETPANTPTASDLTVAAGNDVYIKWKVTASNGLAAQPVSLYYTTDDATYIPVAANLSNAANGVCQPDDAATSADNGNTGCYVWTGGSPTSTYYRIRVSVTDTAGMTTFASSLPLNASEINFVAGNTEVGVGGSATSAVFFNEMSGSAAEDVGSLVVAPTGEVYFRDLYKGLYYVSPANGKLQLLIPTTGTSSGDNGPASAATLRLPYKIAIDSLGRVLIYDYNVIRRVDTTVNPPTISTIIGGGASIADGVGSLSVQISPPGAAYTAPGAKLMPFFVLPNGDIYFQSDAYYNSLGSVYRIRALSAATNTVSSIRLSGTGDAYLDTSDIASCRVVQWGVVYDPLNSSLTKTIGVIKNDVALPNCSYPSSYTFSAAEFDPVTFASTGAPYPVLSATSSTFLQGMNGNLYLVSRAIAKIQVYDKTTKTFTTLVGTGTSGACADGTAALSCTIDPQDAFVTSDGRLYFMDRGRLRTLDANNNVLTIMGQSLSYGDGSAATSARFNVVNAIDMWNDTKVDVLDQQEERFREFTIGGTITTLAGLGGNAIPNTTGLANAQNIVVGAAGVYFDDFVTNPSTGDIFYNRSFSLISRLSRTTGKWVDLVGNNSGTAYDIADGLTGNNISLSAGSGYPARPIGINSNGLATFKCGYASPNVIKSMLKYYTLADGTQSHLLGVSGTGTTTICADGTAGTACTLPTCTTSPLARLSYDSVLNRWLVLQPGTTGIRTIATGGNIATLTTLANTANAFVYKRSADLSTNVVYYCSTTGRLYKRDVNTSTETALTWPISSMSCSGRSLLYNATRGSLIFPYTQNHMTGIAEYVSPP